MRPDPRLCLPAQQVYDWDSQQATIFDITARPIIDACMDGYNGEGAAASLLLSARAQDR